LSFDLRNPAQFLGVEELFDDLRASKRTSSWCATLQDCLAEAFRLDKNANLKKWREAVEALPQVAPTKVCLSTPAVTCRGTLDPDQAGSLERGLRALTPWRKGPFQIFDTFIDTEWRSDLKWDRVQSHFQFEGKDILDVGCGNGYYGWRMIGAGARRVIGLDPYLLYVMQFAALRPFFGDVRHYVLPAQDTVIPPNLRLFDTVLSMGVLYHRKSPIEHLQSLGHALKLGGELILETLVVEGDDHRVLIPQDRYAKMNNVWFLPTCSLLERMLERCGFTDIRVVDSTRTTVEEQRSTDWMTFESLADFLSPTDHTCTVEGHPAPLRAMLLARKS